MRRLNDDTGMAGITVALVITVLLGMAGVAIDVGALYQERRELQNGADAAALAIAEDCALQTVSCDPYTARATASHMATANASDGAAAVEAVVLDPVAQTVTVTLSTLTPEGATVVDPFFAEVVGFDGATVHATATAQWGYPRAALAALPIIISDCEFPTIAHLPTPVETFYFHDGNGAESCNAQAGLDADGDGFLAGGFGWLATRGGCDTFLRANTWVGDDPGSSPSSGCAPDYLRSLVGTRIPLPFFDDLMGLGTNGEYHVAGFALFEITGYHFGGLHTYPRTNPPCSGDERCLAGRFTTGAIYDGEVGGENRGFVIVKLIG